MTLAADMSGKSLPHWHIARQRNAMAAVIKPVHRHSAHGIKPAMHGGMVTDDRQLFRYLALAIILKIIILMLIWWMFVRDAGFSIDGQRVAARIAGAASSQGASK